MLNRAAPAQPDLFEPNRKSIGYELHYHPPIYPETCSPRQCEHKPEHLFVGDVHIVPNNKGGNDIETDHALCLGCGMPQPCTIGGNVLVDCQVILADKGARHWRIFMRIQQIRDKWARIATYLFDENGWNGRHEKIARIIDPKLTMKLTFEPIGGTTRIRMGKIKFDPDYLRWDDEDGAE
jgi:hypothetical protein